MKRLGNLWTEITSFENLLTAAKKAQKAKRFRDNVLEFNYNLEGNLFKLQSQLKSKTYEPGKYRSFRIYDPKPRLISAAPYPDRIVHHALCNIIVPPLEKSFIHDSYANREGFGSHRALRRFTKFCRSSRYILQCDIKKYFRRRNADGGDPLQLRHLWGNAVQHEERRDSQCRRAARRGRWES